MMPSTSKLRLVTLRTGNYNAEAIKTIKYIVTDTTIG